MSARAAASLLGAIALLGATTGCQSTELDRSHPQLASASDLTPATVYFLRPAPQWLGRAGAKISIELGGRELLALAGGDYAVAHLKPYIGPLTVVEISQYMEPAGSNGIPGRAHEERQDARLSQIAFHGDETYYLVVHPSIGMDALSIETVDRARAAALAEQLDPVGDAVAEPIKKH